ncbi:MAG: 50S ribosomal protein L21 [Simkaniaceae bacterium]|nr:50S ribosomal protein L21 [Simkaniaceae bacterium]MCF7852546.1 50S ribosomal protein L21 [Simkaniaceae bacterium]
MYAIIRSGSKQYRVQEGDTIDVELLESQEGQTVEFDEILFYNNGSDIKVGTPHISGFTVEGEILDEVKGPKVIAFKYKMRKSSRKKVGHRQKYSRVKITKIKGA